MTEYPGIELENFGPTITFYKTPFRAAFSWEGAKPRKGHYEYVGDKEAQLQAHREARVLIQEYHKLLKLVKENKYIRNDREYEGPDDYRLDKFEQDKVWVDDPEDKEETND